MLGESLMTNFWLSLLLMRQSKSLFHFQHCLADQINHSILNNELCIPTSFQKNYSLVSLPGICVYYASKRWWRSLLFELKRRNSKRHGHVLHATRKIWTMRCLTLVDKNEVYRIFLKQWCIGIDLRKKNCVWCSLGDMSNKVDQPSRYLSGSNFSGVGFCFRHQISWCIHYYSKHRLNVWFILFDFLLASVVCDLGCVLTNCWKALTP